MARYCKSCGSVVRLRSLFSSSLLQHLLKNQCFCHFTLHRHNYIIYTDRHTRSLYPTARGNYTLVLACKDKSIEPYISAHNIIL